MFLILASTALPFPLTSATTAPYGNTFALVSGFANGEYSSIVYLYDPDLERFGDVDGVAMKAPRTDAAAMFVSKDLFPQCKRK